MPGGGTDVRILIAEDEKRASRGLRNLIMMVSDKHEIVGEAADGKEAFELMKLLEPDVVFTDIKMPYMDGISLIRAARAQDMKIKFVIISAYEEFELARQAISLGVTDYLVKPLVPEDIEDIIHRLEENSSITWDKENRDLKSRYPNAHPLILKAMHIIECSYASKISQKDLAADLGVSAEYFSYLFGRDIGENFSRFLRRYRIEKAQELLLEGNISKDEVLYSVGFSDPKYFNKCFKEETGVNVTEFIKARR
ncbi:response regulator [Blautia producta]|uniref:Stage 0 sporulation protein A homolog n=1 Tax=Blautia producta TaxID=33035 RepID=A0A7G5MZX5_9FIRM|nr:MULTISPECIES: response regulator [Blautia]QMW80168.1 response regulator [Blautia producta]